MANVLDLRIFFGDTLRHFLRSVEVIIGNFDHRNTFCDVREKFLIGGVQVLTKKQNQLQSKINFVNCKRTPFETNTVVVVWHDCRTATTRVWNCGSHPPLVVGVHERVS